jgi:alanine racemase
MRTFAKLVHTDEGEWLQQLSSAGYEVLHLSIDSRKVAPINNTLFFAIKGRNHNAHLHIKELYALGYRMFVVEETIDVQGYKEASFYKVKSSIQALQNIAKIHRESFDIPVIAITGSNAKTIVKDWLAQCLSSKFNVVKSPRSYNSQIGVPLSVWQINQWHHWAVFEAGISKTDEMLKLQNIIQPTYGIFTNIGSAHAEGFESIEQKVKEKMLLFKNVQTLYLCKDHELIYKEAQLNNIPIKTWSLLDSTADLFFKIKSNSNNSIIEFVYKDSNWKLNTSFTDQASIENAMHCINVLVHLNFTALEIQNCISNLLPIEMRLEVKEAKNNCYLVDDSYNNDLAGLRTALDFLSHLKQRTKKYLILSDVLESGLTNEKLNQFVASLIENQDLDGIYTVGKNNTLIQLLQRFKSRHFSTLDQLKLHLLEEPIKDALILIKGARAFGFESLVDELQLKSHETRLEINLDALVHNFNFYKSCLKPNVKVMAMVKAFSYGSGSFEVAQLLQYHGVDYLAVAYVDEGVRLRKVGIQVPIMVMNPSVSQFERMVENKLEPEVYRRDQLEEWIRIANFIKQSISIHLKWDTGMHRLGFAPNQVNEIIELILNQSYVKVVSSFTHLAAADEKQFDAFTLNQLNTFSEVSQIIQSKLSNRVLFHAANSAAIVRLPNAHLDMVRLGIGLYGVDSSNTQQEALQQISTFKTHISQIHELNNSETVGYSRKGKLTKPLSKIAVIEVGYADGYDRRFSNGVGMVNINGILCPVVGNVCMDMTMVDVTDADANIGDEVILFGASPTVSELATKINTIPYEVLTGIGERVKRIYYSS